MGYRVNEIIGRLSLEKANAVKIIYQAIQNTPWATHEDKEKVEQALIKWVYENVQSEEYKDK